MTKQKTNKPHIPTSESMYKVIERLRPYADLKVDMKETCVTECGTPHCFGGYYALACREEGRVLKDRSGRKIKDGYCDFIDGASAMAYDLGFSRMNDLIGWAKSVPSKFFKCGFSNTDTFDPLFGEQSFPKAKNLNDILLTLKCVAKRLKLEESKCNKRMTQHD